MLWKNKAIEWNEYVARNKKIAFEQLRPDKNFSQFEFVFFILKKIYVTPSLKNNVEPQTPKFQRIIIFWTTIARFLKDVE